LSFRQRDEEIGVILAIILRGTQGKEFKELEESKEFKSSRR
jgi:hypothetical protein